MLASKFLLVLVLYALVFKARSDSTAAQSAVNVEDCSSSSSSSSHTAAPLRPDGSIGKLVWDLQARWSTLDPAHVLADARSLANGDFEDQEKVCSISLCAGVSCAPAALTRAGNRQADCLLRLPPQRQHRQARGMDSHHALIHP